MVTIRQDLISESLYSWKSPYKMTPTRIVVHNTANNASADSEIKYMKKSKAEGGRQTSFHYAVDDKEAVQGLPLDRNGWHAGDGNGKGNREGIGIEICYSKSGGTKFTKAEQNAVELIVYLLKKYNWGIDKVTKHQDYSGKYCPHRTLDMGWQRFIKMIEEKLKGKTEEKKTTTTSTNSFFPKKGYFSYGDTHENVGKIAEFMYKNFPSYTSQKALGNYYGKNLQTAIKEFQKRTGLERDGSTGPKTLTMLRKYGFKY